MSRPGFTPLFTSGDSHSHTSIWAFNGHKFSIHIEYTNGDPLGFNYKNCSSIMAQDGTWQRIADNREVGTSGENMYFLSAGDKRIDRFIQDSIDAHLDYIQSVYGPVETTTDEPKDRESVYGPVETTTDEPKDRESVIDELLDASEGDFTQEELEAMSDTKLLDAWLTWNGICGFTEDILEICRKLQLPN